MKNKMSCPNMNHGRMNVPIRYCPSCGTLLNISALANCNSTKHQSMIKNRFAFCSDCGKTFGKK